MADVYLGNHVSDYVKRAGIGKKSGCTLFHHSVTTWMLENGPRYPGFCKCWDTAYFNDPALYACQHRRIYLLKAGLLAKGKLKEVHARTHPADARQEVGWFARARMA